MFVCWFVCDEHSHSGVRAQLHHHLPHPRHPGHEGLGPGHAVCVPSGFLHLCSADLQATSDQQEGLIHGARTHNTTVSRMESVLLQTL